MFIKKYNFDTSRGTVQYKRTVYNETQKKYALKEKIHGSPVLWVWIFPPVFLWVLSRYGD